MEKQYTYSKTIRRQIAKQRILRLCFWIVFGSPFVTFSYDTDLWWMGLCAVLMLAFFESLLWRFGNKTIALSGSYIECHGNDLTQYSSNGDIVAQIDTNTKFKIKYPYFAFGNAIYQVTQKNNKERQVIEFSSMIENAKELVTKVLKHNEFPPGSNVDA